MTRARDIAAGTIFTGADHTKLDGIATGATAYVHPTGAGNQHVPAAGATGQLLQYASAGTAAWATFSAGYEQVTFPSNWASPSETFNSSGTYTKPSGVADDDYIWIYLVGGGGAGCSSGRANGSRAGNTAVYVGGSAGGSAILLYGKAKFFTGGAMIVGAAYPFSAIPSGGSFYYNPTVGNPSTFTLTSSNGSIAYSTNDGDDSNVSDVSSKVIQVDGAGSVSDDYLHSQVSSPTVFSLDTVTTPILSANAFVMGSIQSGNNVSTTQQTSVFAGGNAGARPYNYNSLPTIAQGTSVLAGAGGILNGTDGQFPGGAGRSVTGSGVGGDGAAGQIRIYHV